MLTPFTYYLKNFMDSSIRFPIVEDLFDTFI